MDKEIKLIDKKEPKEYQLIDFYYKAMSDINKKFQEKGIDVSLSTDLSLFKNVFNNENYKKDYLEFFRENNEDLDSSFVYVVLPIHFTKLETKNKFEDILDIIKLDNSYVDNVILRPFYLTHLNYYGDGCRTTSEYIELNSKENITDYVETINKFYSRKLPKHLLDKENRFTNKYYKGISHITFSIDKDLFPKIADESRHILNCFEVYDKFALKVENVIELTLNDNKNYHELKHNKNKLFGRIQDLIEDYNKVCKQYDALIDKNVHKNLNKEVVTLFDKAAYNLESLMNGYDIDKSELNSPKINIDSFVEEEDLPWRRSVPIADSNESITQEYQQYLRDNLTDYVRQVTQPIVTATGTYTSTGNTNRISITTEDIRAGNFSTDSLDIEDDSINF